MLLLSEVKAVSRSFLNVVGGVRGAAERARQRSTQTVPLSSCSNDIRSHKRYLQFSGVETEIQLILAKCEIFEKPKSFWKMTTCFFSRKGNYRATLDENI